MSASPQPGALQRLALALYGLLMWLLQPLMARKLRRRGASEPGYLQHTGERFGRYEGAAPAPGSIWVHAVSLGETRAAAVLIAALRETRPGCRILLTHGTATGRAEGVALLREGDAQAWLPWDMPQAVEAFLQHFRPALGVLMETEVWPALVAACRAHGVPLVLANARLSAKSLGEAQRLGLLARPAFAGLSAVLAQTEADAQRLRRLGAPVQAVLGNLKFDATPDAALLARGRAWRAAAGRPVVMLASSREGEEAALLVALGDFYKQNRPPAPASIGSSATNLIANDVQWMIVPRHPQRFAEVAELVAQAGFSVSVRSQWAEVPAAADVWVGDSLGEMALYYGLADAALLGGSFEPLGGQNLIEAAACGCPVVMGPHTFNFSEAAELALDGGAAMRVQGLDAGVEAAVSLVRDDAALQAMRARALDFSHAHRGAALRTAQALAKHLANGAADSVDAGSTVSPAGR